MPAVSFWWEGADRDAPRPPLPGSTSADVCIVGAGYTGLYAQRPAYDRIALGGRGVPYRFGSRLDHHGATPAATVSALHAALRRLFPAGRTLTDLILYRSTELTALPWVGHRVRRWEPEQVRWLGVRGLYTAYRAADRAEQRGRPMTSPLVRIADAVSGRH